MVFDCSFIQNGRKISVLIDSETMPEAAEAIKKEYKNISYLCIGYPEEATPKMYMGEIPKKTGDRISDFLEWAALHVEYPPEVPNENETFYKFWKTYEGKEHEGIPVLFVEDFTGNIIEYWIFLDSVTIRHEKMKV